MPEPAHAHACPRLPGSARHDPPPIAWGAPPRREPPCFAEGARIISPCLQHGGLYRRGVGGQIPGAHALREFRLIAVKAREDAEVVTVAPINQPLVVTHGCRPVVLRHPEQLPDARLDHVAHAAKVPPAFFSEGHLRPRCAAVVFGGGRGGAFGFGAGFGLRLGRWSVLIGSPTCRADTPLPSGAARRPRRR